MYPVVNTREMRKSFREEVAFELYLKGCLDLDMYRFTDESTVGADMAVRNLIVCMVNNEH